MKKPNILAIIYNYFSISHYRAIRLSELNIVQKWPRQSNPLNVKSKANLYQLWNSAYREQEIPGTLN